MDQDSCFQLGYLAKIHGLKGEIKAVFEADDPNRYSNLESVFVLMDKKLIPFFIERIRTSKPFFIIKFEDIESPEDAQLLTGAQLFLPLDLLPDLPNDEFYYHEIIGFEAIDKNLGRIGVIKDYYSNGPQQLLSIVREEKEILIPMVREFFISLDKQNGTITFDLPEGLIDLYIDP